MTLEQHLNPNCNIQLLCKTVKAAKQIDTSDNACKQTATATHGKNNFCSLAYDMGKITMAGTPYAQTALVCALYTVTNCLHVLHVSQVLQLITHGVQLSSCGEPKTGNHLGIMLRAIYFVSKEILACTTNSHSG
jgi:hypothetical protein